MGFWQRIFKGIDFSEVRWYTKITFQLGGIMATDMELFGKNIGNTLKSINGRCHQRGIVGTLTVKRIREIANVSYNCPYCGDLLTGETVHIDHVKPLSVGGTNTDDNIQLLCNVCNLAKNSMTEELFFLWIKKVVKARGFF